MVVLQHGRLVSESIPSGHSEHFDLHVPSLQLGGPNRRRKPVEDDAASAVLHVDRTRKSPASAVAFLNMMLR